MALPALLTALLAGGLGGCSAVRVTVTDAENGSPIAGATLSVLDAAGHLEERTRSGPDGSAGLGRAPAGSALVVEARDYAGSGLPWPPGTPGQRLAVALEPRAIADFIHTGATTAPPEIQVNRHCPCLDPVEGAPSR
jgi:hypothetical protein